MNARSSYFCVAQSNTLDERIASCAVLNSFSRSWREFEKPMFALSCRVDDEEGLRNDSGPRRAMASSNSEVANVQNATRTFPSKLLKSRQRGLDFKVVFFLAAFARRTSRSWFVFCQLSRLSGER